MINKRIKILIDHYCKGNQSDFARQIGVRSSVIGNMIGERKGNPSFEVLSKIFNAFAEVDARWVITGEGEPFKTDLQTALSDGEKMELLQKIIKKQDIIDALSLKIQRLEKHLTDNDVMRKTMDQLTDEIINQSPEVPGPSFKPAPLVKKKTGKKSVHP